MGIISKLFNKILSKTQQNENAKSMQATANLKPEVGKTHTKVFKVAGVTYGNRQQNLKKIYDIKSKGGRLDISMEQYEYDGDSAVKVTVNGLDIGNLHIEDKDFVLNNQDKIVGFQGLSVNYFEAEDTKKNIYYARIKVLVKNKTQK